MDIYVGQEVKVVYGPSAWLDRIGPVLEINEDSAKVSLSGSDDGGQSVYNVWMPLTCLTTQLKEKVSA